MTVDVSPIGTAVADDIARQYAENPEYRAAIDRLEPFEQLARMVIMRRAALRLSQGEVAKRMGTTASVISRIESGQHRTSTETIRRLALALDGRAMIAFDFGRPGSPQHEIVGL